MSKNVINNLLRCIR